jgi:hypothetical protein
MTFRLFQLLHKQTVQGKHKTGDLVSYRSLGALYTILKHPHHSYVPENRVPWSSEDKYEPKICSEIKHSGA